MEIDYEYISKEVNEFGHKVLEQLQLDYGEFLNIDQIKLIDRLLISDFIIVDKPTEENFRFFNERKGIIDKEKYELRNIPTAHGGRGKGDGFVHIYPFGLSFLKCSNNDEIINVCKESLVIHEIFHYFIQPDKEQNRDELYTEFSSFITEGFVQRYSEIYADNHDLVKPHSLYDDNVRTVNTLMDGMEIDAINYNVFNLNTDEIIESSINGKKVYEDFIIDYNFKKRLANVLEYICDELHIDDKNGIIRHFSKMKDKNEIVKTLNSYVDNIKITDEVKNIINEKINILLSTEPLVDLHK